MCRNCAITYYNPRLSLLRLNNSCLHLPRQSEVLLRHSDDFGRKAVFCLPEICRMTCPRVSTVLKTRPHPEYYHHWRVLSRQMMGENARAFSGAAEQSDIADCDTLIYYWPKKQAGSPVPADEPAFLTLAGRTIFLLSVRTAAGCVASVEARARARRKSTAPVAAGLYPPWSSGKNRPPSMPTPSGTSTSLTA